MRVPDVVNKYVCFIGFRAIENGREITKFAGTGFFVAKPLGTGSHATYLITAKHVMDVWRDIPDGNVVIRMNALRGGGYTEISKHIGEWMYAQEAGVDVAYVSIDWKSVGADCLEIPYSKFVTKTEMQKRDIGFGSPVFFSGLFPGHCGQQKNSPIVCLGTIAMIPEEPVWVDKNYSQAYLIAAGSTGGMSGAPVFVVWGPNGTALGKNIENWPMAFLGLLRGHLKVTTQDVDTGISVVEPAQKIRDVLGT